MPGSTSHGKSACINQKPFALIHPKLPEGTLQCNSYSSRSHRVHFKHPNSPTSFNQSGKGSDLNRDWAVVREKQHPLGKGCKAIRHGRRDCTACVTKTHRMQVGQKWSCGGIAQGLCQDQHISWNRCAELMEFLGYYTNTFGKPRAQVLLGQDACQAKDKIAC